MAETQVSSWHKHYSSDEESTFSHRQSLPYPIADPTPQSPLAFTPLISLPGPDEPLRSPGRRAGRRRSSMSSRGFLKRRADEDFMLMEVQVHTSSTFDNVSDEEEDGTAWGLLDNKADDPVLWRRGSIASTKSRQSSLSVGSKRPRLPPNDYLDEEYQRTKLRFIESTMRSEQTRIIVQRQRSLLLQRASYHPIVGCHHNPYSSYSDVITEENRRRLLSSLKGGSIMTDI